MFIVISQRYSVPHFVDVELIDVMHWLQPTEVLIHIALAMINKSGVNVSFMTLSSVSHLCTEATKRGHYRSMPIFDGVNDMR